MVCAATLIMDLPDSLNFRGRDYLSYPEFCKLVKLTHLKKAVLIITLRPD